MCREGKWMEATNALYGPHIVSIEPHAPPPMKARVEGIEAVRGKAEWWEQNHTVHHAEIEGPWPHGDRFIVKFKLDVTSKAGPMAGKRFTMEEAGLYTVKDGKVVEEQFFYHMG
jgi:ketosteroid isomerase-like protein